VRWLVSFLALLFVVSLISPAIGAVIAGTSMCVALASVALLWRATREH
jgi:hypothetical protein